MLVGISKEDNLQRKHQRTKHTTQKNSNLKNNLLTRSLVDSDDNFKMTAMHDTILHGTLLCDDKYFLRKTNFQTVVFKIMPKT